MIKRNINNTRKGISENNLITLFKVLLIALTFTFYYNTIFNHFSLDDYHINTSNPQTVKGIAGIPEIFSTLYADESGMTYGYRPMVRASFALEYQFTAGLNTNPYISHFINILLYILAVLLLYKVLRRLFENYNPWFPFLVTLIFMVHPTHTEVVASLKNRDIILNFIFSFIAIWQFLRWADTDKIKHLIFGIISFVFALLSKETALAQLAVFPLILYFFSDIRLKKLGVFTLLSIGVVILFFLSRKLLLPDTSRYLRLLENPLVANDSFMLQLSTGFYILGHYLKFLFIPFPLLYYYGFNMIPVVGWSNPWVITSFITYTALFVFAIVKFREKNILSFTILYFFINISMYANIVAPVPGIVGDRFVFFATISLSIFIVWLFFTVFRIPLINSDSNKIRIIWVIILTLLIIIPSGYYVHKRNAQWRTHYTLYTADMPKLWNSVKANDLYANELIKEVNKELAKPVNPYKFIVGIIDKAEKHFKQAINIDSTHYSSWNNLGIIYSKLHGNQAKLRYESYLKNNNLEKAKEEKILSEEYFNTAINYFHKAIYYNPNYGSAYFNLANTFELQDRYDSSIVYFRKTEEVDGGEIYSMSRLANAYYLNDQIDEAVKQNQKIILAYPNSDMPYINLGNYAVKANDMDNSIKYFSKAFELGNNPTIGKLISNYYSSIGDKKNADYYLRKSYEAEKSRMKKRK